MMTNFEDYINNFFNSFESNSVVEAMKYSMSNGKRIRPQVIFAIAKGFGINEEECYPCALALEMIQTYSLIHDDLPCMDNDDLRRGKPSCHKAFGEGIALLAGDCLLTHCFETIADSTYDNYTKSKMISCLSKYAGMKGMVYGQLLDVENKLAKTKENLFLIEDNKTGGLFKIACLFAMYLGKVEMYSEFELLGSKIGEIFQLQDDLMDVTRSEEEMGKSLSDEDNDKFTALNIYSIDELKKIIEDKFKELKEYTRKLNLDSKYLIELIEKMAKR